MINRLIQIPMTPENYKEKLNIMKYLAQKNDYHPLLIDRLHNKIRKNRNKRKNRTDTNDNKKYITLIYINKTTNKIAETFKKEGYNIAYRTQTTKHHTTQQNTNTKQIRPTRDIQIKMHIAAEYTYANYLTNTEHTNIDTNMKYYTYNEKASN